MMLRTVNGKTECWCTDRVNMGALSTSYPKTPGAFAVYDLGPMAVTYTTQVKTTHSGGGLVVTSTRLALGYRKFGYKLPGNFFPISCFAPSHRTVAELQCYL